MLLSAGALLVITRSSFGYILVLFAVPLLMKVAVSFLGRLRAVETVCSDPLLRHVPSTVAFLLIPFIAGCLALFGVGVGGGIGVAIALFVLGSAMVFHTTRNFRRLD